MDEHIGIADELSIPRVFFGTSGLGNLFVAIDHKTKREIVRECITHSKNKVVFDTAGKYGAGLALEELGRCLHELDIPKEKVIVSNKLGWLRTALKTPEPTFEPGVWKGLTYDAVQRISYGGILSCFEQGNQLLNGYNPQWVSVHDPDEYLATAKDAAHEAELYQDILEAYRALADLKRQGSISAIGVGAKNWKVIRRIASEVALDWIMIANSLTIKTHPPELLGFVEEMANRGVFIINSAVFHSGFLIGGDHFDYKYVKPGIAANDALFEWRQAFFSVCQQFDVVPAEACVQFAFHIPGIKSVALSTTSPKRIKQNVAMTDAKIPASFWDVLREKKLIRDRHR